MLTEFAGQLSDKANVTFDVETNRIRYVLNLLITRQDLTLFSCLAHIIHLATQAVISTHSKSKHYDPQNPDAHLPLPIISGALGDPNRRDEIGLVRAIAVKVSCLHLVQTH